MLMKCPECELQVSDKAVSCPHCGYPLKEQNIKRPYKSYGRRKRLPNGFGQISELKGSNLRKPFRAMVTIGKTDEGKPICKLLQPEAYFKTYNEAYQALIEYHRNPYVLENTTTVKELYERWSQKYFAEVSESTIRAMKGAWNYCRSTENINVSQLRPRHIRYCMEEATVNVKGIERTPSPQIRSRIKILFNKMLDYAVSYELVDKNYSRNFIAEKIHDEPEVTHHIPYSDEEIELLKQNINKLSGVDVILIQCYTGWRPIELVDLKIENINLQDRIMVGGTKTKAGKNRTVPIHHAIFDLVKKRYDESVSAGSEYLFSIKDLRSGKADRIRKYNRTDMTADLKNIIKELNLNKDHKSHDGRAHFITQAKKYNLDEYAIKYIVGHTITDITESVYTNRKFDWLLQEIEKIP